MRLRLYIGKPDAPNALDDTAPFHRHENALRCSYSRLDGDA